MGKKIPQNKPKNTLKWTQAKGDRLWRKISVVTIGVIRKILWEDVMRNNWTCLKK